MKRYELDNVGIRDDNFQMVESASGDFVKFADVEPLLAELNLLRSKLNNDLESAATVPLTYIPARAGTQLGPAWEPEYSVYEEIAQRIRSLKS